MDGAYTAAPRLVPSRRKIDRISYVERRERASLGAQVIHSRSVEFAKKFGIAVEVLSSFNDGPGTILSGEGEEMEDLVIRGVTVDRGEAKLTIQRVPDRPGIAAAIFKTMAEENVNVDMIIQNVSEDGFTDVSFTVASEDFGKALRGLERMAASIGAKGVTSNKAIAKVSVVGVGMRSHKGVASAMFEALAREGINIKMISTSEIKISCVVDEADAGRAARAVHSAFGLDRDRRLSLIHISEPTRLLSISYAVFCLKKKKQRVQTNTKRVHQQYARQHTTNDTL